MKGTRHTSLLALTCIIVNILLHQVQSEPQRRQGENQQPKAERCDPNRCRLPDCFCGGQTIPGGFKPEQIPQFVLLTFDDAVNGINKEFFAKLFKERYNPNGCPIKVTIREIHISICKCDLINGSIYWDYSNAIHLYISYIVSYIIIISNL